MKKKTFVLLTALLAACTLLNTAVFAVEESAWFRANTGEGLEIVRLDDSARA